MNSPFDIITPANSGEIYEGKADSYGYYGIGSIDSPQRFGNKAFFDYGWSDSELRYVWKKLTIGFRTQAIWLGPVQFNPLLFSNNAAPFLKFDAGIRKQSITKYGYELGFIEARAFWGRLGKSDIFDTAFQAILFAELTNLESSRDYELIGWSTTFYTHHLIKQGYTNKEQWLGAGMGTGGNSQIIGLDVFSDHGTYRFFVQRRNPDNDYIWFMRGGREREYRLRADVSVCLEAYYDITSRIRIRCGFTLVDSINNYYDTESKDENYLNVQIATTLSILL